MTTSALFPSLASYVAGLEADFDQISDLRRALLDKLAHYVGQAQQAGRTPQLVFICTHNSRRSHLGQLWAAALTHHYGAGPLETYSGGTEATAFNPRAVAALQAEGFRIEMVQEGTNPVYEVHYAEGVSPLRAWSKVFDAPGNPQQHFGAVMTCAEADAGCPFVPGADLRIALTYEDPKAFDDTPQETEKYRERSHQIARELAYAFARLKK